MQLATTLLGFFMGKQIAFPSTKLITLHLAKKQPKEDVVWLHVSSTIGRFGNLGWLCQLDPVHRYCKQTRNNFKPPIQSIDVWLDVQTCQKR